MEHRYIATNCIHDRHIICGLTCKVCGAPCLCECHRPGGLNELRPDGRRRVG